MCYAICASVPTQGTKYGITVRIEGHSKSFLSEKIAHDEFFKPGSSSTPTSQKTLLQVAEPMRVSSFGALSCTMVCYNVRVIFFVNTFPQERMKNS